MKNNILTERQICLLELIGQNTALAKDFYFTGGTALAALYLKHRYSEDLDFFSEKEIAVSGITVFWESIREKLKIIKIDFEQSYNRNLFFLHFPDKEVIKTEFTFFPFPPIEEQKKFLGVKTDSLLDIAANKLFTIYQKTRARDYIDLYFIFQNTDLTMTKLVKMTKAKFDWHLDPLQLGTQFSKANEAIDYPRMIKPIEEKVWQNFFLAEAKKLSKQILTD